LIKNDVVEKLEQKLLKWDSTQDEFENLVDRLKRQGKAALLALIEIRDNALVHAETTYVSKAINEASKY